MIRAALENAIYILRACRKPTLDEIIKHFRIVIIGVIIIGIIGFVVHKVLHMGGVG